MAQSQFNIDAAKRAQFSLKRKPLASSYTSIRKLHSYFDKNRSSSGSVVDLTTYTNGAQLDALFKNIGSQNDKCVELSNALYYGNRVYATMLDFLSNMYYFRYITVPRQIKPNKPIGKEEYDKIYHSMLEYVDGVNIEVVFPELLGRLFRMGQIFVTVAGHSSSKAVSTMILPNKYCKPTFQTQYGTLEFKFDFSFFDSLGLDKEQLAILLERFPEEFAERYEIYSNSSNKTLTRWQTLDPRYSCCFQMNEEGFPSFLSVFYDIINHKTYKLNELDRNTNLLERLVIQEIDMEKTNLDMTEVEELHDSMATTICSSPGTTLLTTVGKVTVEPLQEQIGEKNDILQNSFRSIFNEAGLNDALFTGESTADLSIKRNLAFVWHFIEQLEAFYNLALNNIKSFGPFQLSLRILKASPYTAEEDMNLLHQSATLGVGVLDYIIASGTKQVDLDATIQLEKHLDLVNKLVPLASSHTQSSSAVNNKPKGDEEDSKESNSEDGAEPSSDDKIASSSQEDSNADSNVSNKKIKKGDNNE